MNTATNTIAGQSKSSNASQARIISVIHNDIIDLNNHHRSTPKPTKDNWKDVLERMKISFQRTYKEPPICIEVVQADGTTCSFGTLGNFSVLIGKAKSRKTFLISLFIAAYIGRDLLGSHIKVSLPVNKKRIIFLIQSNHHMMLVE